VGTYEIDPAFAELCRREHVRLVGLLALYTGDRAVAEDLAQEVLLRLHQHWPRVRLMGSPHAWLSSVGINPARSWWRRRYAEQRAFRRLGATRSNASGPEPSDVVAVRSAVAALPPRQPAALVLRYYGGLSLDWSVDTPITLRWRFGDDNWTTGTPPPFGLRDYVGAAFDGSRLALWGGSDGSSTLNDGAIYAVAADTWTVIPTGPLPSRVHAATVWSDGRLVVGGGLDRLVDAGEYLRDMAAYDPANESWKTLPPPPEGGLGDPQSTWSFVEGETTLVVADSKSGSGEPEPRWFYGPDGWEQAPLGGIMDLGGFIVSSNFGSIAYELRVRVGPNERLEAADTPFDSRMGTTTVPTSSGKLVVVGGWEGSNLDPKDDTWVFDLAG
jgi:RNA polymerase sigma-70 factor (ECF subfamily)